MRIKIFIKFHLVSFIILIFGCVEPPDYDDGLLLNIPAIVNEADYFSLSLNAEDLTENYIWELEFESENEDTLFTTLVVKDFSSISSDSTFIKLYNSNNAEIFHIYINGQTTSISDIAIEYIGNPTRLELIAAKLNCILDLQLIKQ